MAEDSLSAQLLHQYGYAGLVLGLLAGSMGIPVSTEILLPLSGALARAGQLDLAVVSLVAVTAQVAGFVTAYLIARHGGISLLERYGKYVFINHRRLTHLHKLLHRHGFRIVFAGLYLPGAHGYMGYVAGLGGMRFPVFALLAVTSTIVWTAVFLGLGMMLSNQLNGILQAMSGIGLIITGLVVLGILGFWYYRQHAR